MITLVCGRCGNPAAHGLRKLVTKFTFFFIPLFPLSTKHYLECTWCGASSPVAVPQIPDLLARANAETMGPGQSAPGGPNAHWQQPALSAPTPQWQQQPAPGAPDAAWQQPATGAPNAAWQQPAPGAPSAHSPQSIHTPNGYWQQR
ncbi:zinc-ribbon domain-containing protein [Nocardia abscessus]|uniref:zinc-ribbon domain-containing protein n=1 Tax=Nocardia abscessus TaxID=120957 RepID=UPI00189461CB|nr:zinc-ribbon domain-containing protein [Nocardia abscessus]MBF6336596.1 zinc-ribbon domain-containing protein [Nocardia abscessus]